MGRKRKDYRCRSCEEWFEEADKCPYCGSVDIQDPNMDDDFLDDEDEDGIEDSNDDYDDDGDDDDY